MKATTQLDLLDVSLLVSSGEAFATKKRVNFLFKGNMKQLESYIYNVCQLWSFRVDVIISVYDVNARRYICKFGGIK